MREEIIERAPKGAMDATMRIMTLRDHVCIGVEESVDNDSRCAVWRAIYPDGGLPWRAPVELLGEQVVTNVAEAVRS